MRAEQLSGVVLAGLDPQSRLARSGLRPGDIVTAVNRQPIQGLVDFEQLVPEIRGPLLFQLRRNGNDYVARID
jgi:serine protease DegQ